MLYRFMPFYAILCRFTPFYASGILLKNMEYSYLTPALTSDASKMVIKRLKLNIWCKIIEHGQVPGAQLD